MQRKTKTVLTTALLGAAWIASVALGLRILLNYESAAGAVGIVSRSWPSGSVIHLANDRPTLVMLAHPRCPCTRASMGELAQLMARVQGKVLTYVLFYTPRESDGDWENTDLRRTAAQIPGVTVLSDVDGVEARRFGAETSGHTFLFAADGRLLFNGGITRSRGHSGDNAGERAIVSLINNRTAVRAQTSVFGCALNNRGEQAKAALCLK